VDAVPARSDVPFVSGSARLDGALTATNTAIISPTAHTEVVYQQSGDQRRQRTAEPVASLAPVRSPPKCDPITSVW
jgi:hypothetical protein